MSDISDGAMLQYLTTEKILPHIFILQVTASYSKDHRTE